MTEITKARIIAAIQDINTILELEKPLKVKGSLAKFQKALKKKKNQFVESNFDHGRKGEVLQQATVQTLIDAKITIPEEWSVILADLYAVASGKKVEEEKVPKEEAEKNGKKVKKKKMEKKEGSKKEKKSKKNKKKDKKKKQKSDNITVINDAGIEEKRTAPRSTRARTKERLVWMAAHLEKGIDKKELIEITKKEFGCTHAAVTTNISNGKNPKYNAFDKLIVQDGNNIKFEK